MLVALSGFGALGGPRSDASPASVSAYSAPDAVGVAATSYPAALFPAYVLPATYSDEVRQTAPNDDNHPGETTIALAPTAAEVQAATLRVQEVGGSLTEAEVRAVLTEAGWPAELHDEALAVAWCESRWSPYGDNGVDKGLFQLSFAPNATLRGSWYAYYGVDESLWADPLTNATVALWIHQRSGWGPWSCKPWLK